MRRPASHVRTVRPHRRSRLPALHRTDDRYSGRVTLCGGSRLEADGSPDQSGARSRLGIAPADPAHRMPDVLNGRNQVQPQPGAHAGSAFTVSRNFFDPSDSGCTGAPADSESLRPSEASEGRRRSSEASDVQKQATRARTKWNGEDVPRFRSFSAVFPLPLPPRFSRFLIFWLDLAQPPLALTLSPSTL